jgi:dTDP-4-amino-4,6-dideoxygalactose transaminase
MRIKLIDRTFLPFALPDIDTNDIQAVVDTLSSGWVTTGPKTKEFEEKFANFIGGGVDAIAVNSATSGLHLALEACGVSNDDEVITTTLTFTATAETIRYLGAHPVFIDIDPQTLNIDISKIEENITPRTKAIVVVHMAGLPCDMFKVIEVARRHNLKVIEDAAHALPSKINNTIIGRHDSDAIVYSFYATKTITTGEGGMIVTKNHEIAKRCKIMRLHGISRDAFDRYVSTKPSWYYEIVAPGFKYNLSDIASSLGISQLTKVDIFYQKRLKMAMRYMEELQGLPIKLPPNIVNKVTDMHSWHLFLINLLPEANITRDDFINKMSEHKVGTSVHFIPLHMQPYWKNEYKLKDSSYPYATKYYKTAVSLPIYTKMTEDDQSYVIKTIFEVLTQSMSNYG